jgi:hypothetical protein
VELEKLHKSMVGVEDECAAKAVHLSRSVMEITDTLVVLAVFPIWDIPSQPRSVQDVQRAVSLVLVRLQEGHASVADSEG